jgi:hypothetical protein
VDIQKKSSARKGKFLFAFPGLITAYNDNTCSNNTTSSQSQSQSQSQSDPSAAEVKTSQTSGLNSMKLGTLDQLDTLEPVLYVDFPTGRLKMEGRIIYPKNRYLTLQFSQTGKNVVCQDIFDKIVVFPKVTIVFLNDTGYLSDFRNCRSIGLVLRKRTQKKFLWIFRLKLHW